MTTTWELDRELDAMADAELRGARALPMPRMTNDERTFAVGTHLVTVAAALSSMGLLDVIVPAVAHVAAADKGERVKSHVRQQLNFQLTRLLVTVLAGVFTFFTFGLGALIAVPVVLFFFVADIVCSVKAAMAASRGDDYRFPFTIDFVK